MAKSKNQALVIDEAEDTTVISEHEVLPAVLSAEDQAKVEIKKFDLPRAWIAAKKADYSELEIDGVDDKQGYKAVHNAWQEVRAKRIGVEKKGDEIKAGYLVIQRGINAEQKDLVTLLKEIEDPLGAKLDFIDNAKKREAEERERQIQLQLQNRVSELIENGIVFSGSYYTIGETISMDVVTLKGFSETEYSAFLDRVKATNRDILEAKRVAEQQKEDERLKLEKQKEDQETERLRLKGIQDGIDERNKKLQEKIVAIRSKELTALGMTYDYKTTAFGYRDAKGHSVAFVSMEFIISAEDDPFETEVLNLSGKIQHSKGLDLIDADIAENKKKADAKLAADKKILDDRTAAREYEILSLFGIRRVNIDDLATYQVVSKILPENHISLNPDTLVNSDANAWANVINELKKQFKKFQAADDKRQKELDDAKELKRLSKMGDGERLEDILGQISAPLVMGGEKAKFKTPEGQAAFDKFDTAFTKLLSQTHADIDNLK